MSLSIGIYAVHENKTSLLNSIQQKIIISLLYFPFSDWLKKQIWKNELETFSVMLSGCATHVGRTGQTGQTGKTGTTKKLTTHLLHDGVTNKYTGTWNMATKKAREKFMAAIVPMTTEKSMSAAHLSM